MRRRDVLALISAAAASGSPYLAKAQTKKTLVGVLMGFDERDSNARALVKAFSDTLASFGWNAGNTKLEVRWGSGDPEKMRTFAHELVELRPDVLLAQTTPVLRALAHETHGIPIIFAVVSDPIGMGLAATLTRPGGNVSGFTDAEPEMGGKWVQLLRGIAPRQKAAPLLFQVMVLGHDGANARLPYTHVTERGKAKQQHHPC